MYVCVDTDVLRTLQIMLKDKPTINESNAEQTLADLVLSYKELCSKSERPIDFRFINTLLINVMYSFKHQPIFLPTLLALDDRNTKLKILATLIVLHLWGPDDVTDYSDITLNQKSDMPVNLAEWGMVALTATEKLVQITQRIDEYLLLMNTRSAEDQPLFDFGLVSNYIPEGYGIHARGFHELKLFSSTASTSASSPTKIDPDASNPGPR